MNTLQGKKTCYYRSIWLSDIHLGHKGCKAEYLLDFLQSMRSGTLYLVGDVIDVWSMQRNMHWPPSHNSIVRAILEKAREGTRIIYIPGNHDEQFREYAGMIFGNIEIHDEYVHLTPAGKRILLLHGDIYDAIMKCSSIKNYLGNLGYELLLYINRHVSKLRNRMGLPYWSLSAFVKRNVSTAMQHVYHFEKVVAYDAKKRGFDGVVCGHIHYAGMREIDGTLYCNDGDWVENCTALVEGEDGQLELLHWTERQMTLHVRHADRHAEAAAA